MKITGKIFSILGILLIITLSGSVLSRASQAENEERITIDEILITGLDHPVQITNAEDGSNRLFIVEQSGRIRVFQNGALVQEPFLDITGQVSSASEQGLLGLAFHPNFSKNGLFYINFTDLNGSTVIRGYKVSDDPNRANPQTAFEIFSIPQPFSNHNGGQLSFGPDGYLYIGMGDGGSAGDPNNNAQNLSSPLGKMLRVSVSENPGYLIPEDNPFINNPQADPRIWALGLRNPWRFSFDRLTGDLYIADVGQNEIEEVNFQKSGENGGINYGWHCFEGSKIYNSEADCSSQEYLDTMTLPVTEYTHQDGRSITGGFVYRGNLYPELYGTYFYADYISGTIWSINLLSTTPFSWSSPRLEIKSGVNISAFGEDEFGEIYLADYTGGTIRKLQDKFGPPPNFQQSDFSTDIAYANTGDVLTFTLNLANSGGKTSGPLNLAFDLPVGLEFIPAGFSSSTASVNPETFPQLILNQTISANSSIKISFQTLVTAENQVILTSRVNLFSDEISPIIFSKDVYVPVPQLNTTANDLFLPGTQPDTLFTPLQDSIDCDTCHNEPIYAAWRGSMMSNAGRDPIFWSALSVANAYAPQAGEYCLRCHTPNGWYSGRSSDTEGGDLLPADINNGVSCALCHRMLSSTRSNVDELADIDAEILSSLEISLPLDHSGSAMIILDPFDRRRGPFSFDPALIYHTAYQTEFLGNTKDPVQRSAICASCHNVDNPVLSWDEEKNVFWINTEGQKAESFGKDSLFPIERTYEEWRLSQYAAEEVFAPQYNLQNGDPGGLYVSACQDCHMRYISGTAADEQFLSVMRDCQDNGCLATHEFLGANILITDMLSDPAWRLSTPSLQEYLEKNKSQTSSFLQNAAAFSLEMISEVNKKTALVRVTNQTGHKLPTGYPEGRRIWIQIRAYGLEGELLYESGAYDREKNILIQDADIKIYEAKQGLTQDLADYLGLDPGESFHFILNNTTLKDNRIPPRGYTETAYDHPGLRPVGAIYKDGQYWDITEYELPAETTWVIARLYYQTASGEYVSFLSSSGNTDADYLYDRWSSSSPETFVLMAEAYWPQDRISQFKP